MVPFDKFFTSVYIIIVYAYVCRTLHPPLFPPNSLLIVLGRSGTSRLRRTIPKRRTRYLHPYLAPPLTSLLLQTFKEGVEYPASLIGEIVGDSISFILPKLELSEGSVTYKGGYSRGENKLTLSRHKYEFRHIGFPDLMLSSPERH